jgi:hypothetical protein
VAEAVHLLHVREDDPARVERAHDLERLGEGRLEAQERVLRVDEPLARERVVLEDPDRDTARSRGPSSAGGVQPFSSSIATSTRRRPSSRRKA